MLTDWHTFEYRASVPWPVQGTQPTSWCQGVTVLETWLTQCVGPHWANWAWDRATDHYQVGVAFRWDQDRLLFVMAWN